MHFAAWAKKASAPSIDEIWLATRYPINLFH
jgi:hypothetical protein